MRQLLVIANQCANSLRMRGHGIAESSLQIRLARAEQSKLSAQPDETRKRVQHQVETLLPGEPRYCAEQWRIQSHVEAKPQLQRCFCHGLSCRRILDPVG